MDWLWITGNLCRLLLNQLSVTPVKMTASGQWYSPIQVKDILSVGVQAPVLRVTTPEKKGFENHIEFPKHPGPFRNMNSYLYWVVK